MGLVFFLDFPTELKYERLCASADAGTDSQRVIEPREFITTLSTR